MYYGKTTPKLEKLYKEYYNVFGIYPYGHEELDYSEEFYDEYAQDILIALKTKNIGRDR